MSKLKMGKIENEQRRKKILSDVECIERQRWGPHAFRTLSWHEEEQTGLDWWTWKRIKDYRDGKID